MGEMDFSLATVVGLALIPAGFWISIMALRYQPYFMAGRSIDYLVGCPFFVGVVGGVVGALGFVLLISPP